MPYLKGNYTLEKPAGVVESSSVEKGASEEVASTAAFEEFARTRLGGSIAFVMKNNTFVWTGPSTINTDKDEGNLTNSQ